MALPKANGWLEKGRRVLAIATLAVYPFISYRANVGKPGPAGALFAFLPLLVFSLSLAWGARPRALWLALWVLGGVVLWRYRAGFMTHYSWAYFVQDMGVLLLLCGLFARTLVPSRTPLISRLSLLVHGSVSPRLARYTRHVTELWAALFAVLALVSALLFFGAGIRVWAFYANVLVWPIMVAVFAGEYLVRRRIVPPHERAGFLEVVRAGRRYWHIIIREDEDPNPLNRRALP